MVSPHVQGEKGEEGLQEEKEQETEVETETEMAF